ncbi:MAG: DMT family transporter [Betaproteobacteria bacterium]|nr:DMT family transporter [Betaproteobacteria bacterium]
MIGATVCWASAGTLVRHMSVKDSWEITFWRSLFMMIFIGGYLLHKRRRTGAPVNFQIGRAGLVSGMLWASMYVSFLVALGRTTVASTLVICSIAPFLAALAGKLFLQESLPARTWVAMLVAFSGIAVMFAGSMGGGAWLGNLIAVLIPIAFAANVVMLRRMHASADTTVTLLASGIISMLVTLPVALPFEVGAKDLALLAIMGSVQLGLGCLLMIHTTPRLAAAEIGLLSILETLFGTFATWLFAGERPALATLTGGLVVIGALALNELIGMRRQSLTPTEKQALQSSSGH